MCCLIVRMKIHCQLCRTHCCEHMEYVVEFRIERCYSLVGYLSYDEEAETDRHEILEC